MGCILMAVAGCRAETAGNASGGICCPVHRDKDFGAVNLGMKTEDFNASGFEFGDGCDVLFSNGYRLEDVPYYDGYYTRTNGMLICAYPGYEYPKISCDNGPSLWEASGLSEGDTVTVTLREKGKYLDVQQAMELVYSMERDDFGSDEVFANFRALTGGAIAKDRFFRGASPVDNRMSRAATTDRLLKERGIRFVLDLADTDESLEGFRSKEGFSSGYFMELYGEHRVCLLGLTMDCRGREFRTALAGGLRAMMKNDGPVYIHCLEGKDRTGFVCMLLEALAGASVAELREDYMKTYENYYGVTEASDPARYRTILSLKFEDQLQDLTDLPDGADLGGTVLRDCARQYLLDSGMTEEEIDALTVFLTGE